MRQKAQRIKEVSCQLLGCSGDEYCDYQYRQGRQWLQSYISRSPEFIDKIIATQAYWAWWRNHWVLREEVWICQMLPQGLDALAAKNADMPWQDMQSQLERWRTYEDTHHYLRLLRVLNFNKEMLELGYSQLIEDLKNSDE